MGKVKKEVQDTEANESVAIKEEDTYEDKVKHANKIASPMAPKKLTKKLYKLIKKGVIFIEIFNLFNLMIMFSF